MKTFSIDTLWKPASKTASASSAELLAETAVWDEKKATLIAECAELANGKTAAFERGGPQELKKIQERIREIEDDLEICDVSLEGLNKRASDAKAREDVEKLRAASKQWHIDQTEEEESRDETLEHLVKAFASLERNRAANEKNKQWRSNIGKADALGLKPVDKQAELLAKKGVNRPHPVNDAKLYTTLKEAAGFKELLLGLNR